MTIRSYRWLLFSLAAFGFVADQSSKYGMFRGLYTEGQFFGQSEVIPGAFKFFVQYDRQMPVWDCALARANGPISPKVNHGALFSLGGEYKTDANKFFAVVSALAAIGISVWGCRKSTSSDRWLCLALGLILGGTLGNLYDRVIFGGVRDFLYFYLIDWPVFNVADCCLVIGAALLLIQAIFTRPKTVATESPATAVPVVS